MKNGKKVSIIIPNYNGEKYLKRCLESIIKQDYNNKEIIVIDDGSTDKSIDIIRKITQKTNQIKLLKNKHSGPNIARKTGINYAHGDYIMFVDSDDYLNNGAISMLVEMFDKYDVDTIRFNYCKEDKKDVKCPIIKENESDKVIDNKEIFKILLTTYRLNCLWCQIYKKKIVANIKAFDNKIKLGEDFIANLEMHNKTKAMLLLNSKPLYTYCENKNSTTRLATREAVLSNIVDRIKISKIALKYLDKVDKSLQEAVIFTQVKMIWDYIVRLSYVKSYNKATFMNDIKKVLPKQEFESIDSSKISQIINGQKLKKRIKFGKAVKSVALSDYESIWKCIRRYKLVKKVLGK